MLSQHRTVPQALVVVVVVVVVVAVVAVVVVVVVVVVVAASYLALSGCVDVALGSLGMC